MPSPFPGMNPYLEQPDCWEDFHLSYMKELRDRLAARLSPHYIAKLESHIYVHEVDRADRAYVGQGDLGIAETMKGRTGGGAGLLDAPVMVRLPVVETTRSAYLEIRDRERRRLVTVLEMLSPTNKYSGPDREAFLAKRRNLLNGPVNYVELDLLRGGPRLPVPDLPPCEYYVLVRRTVDWPDAGLWPLKLRDPLPTIGVPLSEEDPAVDLDLQEALHAVYEAAHYGNYIYRGEPQPGLSAEDAAWAVSLLPSRAENDEPS